MNKIDFKPSVMLNPVPAVMISSRNKEGKDNIFTVSWVNTICTRPPMLSISIRPERLSYDYIKESMEFIVNIPSTDLTYETDYCGVKTGKKIDKIKELNLEMVEGSHVKASYIKKCPVTIECRVKNIIPLGSHDLFIADVLGSHVNENLLDEKGKIHFEFGNLITYSHGEYFPMSQTPIGHFGFSTKINKEDSMKLQNKPQSTEESYSHKKSSKNKKNNNVKNPNQNSHKKISQKSNFNKKKLK